MTRTLQEKLDSVKARFESEAPADVLEIMHKATEELNQSGLVDKALNLGDTLPPLALKDETGQVIRSEALLDKGPLVLSFYRGMW